MRRILFLILFLPLVALAQPMPGNELQCNAGTGWASSGLATAARQDTGNTSLASIATQTDGIEGSVDGLEGYVDGVETLLTSIDATTEYHAEGDYQRNTINYYPNGGEIYTAQISDTKPLGVGPSETGDFGLVTRIAGGVAMRDVFDSDSLSSATSLLIDIAAGGTSLLVEITGTWTGTINIRGTPNSSAVYANMQNLACVDLINGGPITDITANGLYVCNTAGLYNLRIGAPSWSSGTATLKTGSSVGIAPMVLGQELPAGTQRIGGTTSMIGSSNAEGGAGNVSAATQRMTIATDDVNLAAIKTQTDGLEGSVDGLEGYLDGVEGTLTSIGTAVGLIAGYVDGLEGYLDGLEGYLDGLEGYVDGIETRLNSFAGGKKYLARQTSDVDNSAILVFDASAANSGTIEVVVTNAGEDFLYCTLNDSTPVADSSTADYNWRLVKGESVTIDVGYTASATTNDIYCIRNSAQTNDNVVVLEKGWRD